MRGLLGFALSAVLTFSSAAFAAPERRQTGFLKVAPDRSLYIDFELPDKGKPVIVLVNGLTYKTSNWDGFVRGLQGEGYGILRFDPMGHGKTLLKHAPQRDPLPIEQQLKDMRRIFEMLGLTRQPIHIVGLSYGGGLATLYSSRYPEHVANCIAIAPFTEPLPMQHNWILSQVRTARLINPLNPATDDQLYDFYLRNLIYATYPAAEPQILENPYRLEATFRLVQGIRKYRFDDIAHKMPKGKFHLVIARHDEVVPASLLQKAWEETPPHARRSLIYIEESRHRVPETKPAFSAAVVKLIVSGHPAFDKGRTLVAVPSQGVVRSGREIVASGLPKR